MNKHWMFFASLLACAVLFSALAVFPAQAGEKADEDRCVAVLTGDADWFKKQEACRELRIVGTVRSVPALAALLSSPELSHLARYALESMPYPEVDTALCAALPGLDAPHQAGVAATLGARRSAKAVAPLEKLLKSGDTGTVCAAAGALGRIATAKSVRALDKFRKGASGAERFAAEEGLLAAADSIAREKRGARKAARLYESLLGPDTTPHVRSGAFYGLARVLPAKAPKRMLAALAGDDPVFRDMAARVVAETEGAEDTALYAAALPGLPPGGQTALVRALGDRGDTAARPAVVGVIEGTEKPVRLAAMKALSVIGGVEEVPLLAGLMASGDEEIAAGARAALATVDRKGVDEAIAAALPGAPPAVRAELLGVLLDRRAAGAVPAAVAQLESADAVVREAALRTISVLGGGAQAPLVVAAMERAGDSAARAAAENTLGALCARCGADVFPFVVQTLSTSKDNELRAAMLRALTRIGGPEALRLTLAAVNDSDPGVAGTALRELSDWPTPDAAPHLLAFAGDANDNRHVLGLRGYVRFARQEADAAKKAEMLDAAMKLARAAEEKWLVLAAWGTLKTPQTLDALMPFLHDPQASNEAGSAVVAVATELIKTGPEYKRLVTDALNNVLGACTNPAVRESAKKVLAGLQ